MKEEFYTYFIRSGWPEHFESTAVIATKFLKTLDRLSGLDPIFARWAIFDARAVSSLSLAVARSRMTAIIEDNVARDDFDQPALVYGYHASAAAGKFKDPRSANLRVRAGGRYENGAVLEFGDYDVAPDLAIITYPLFKTALLAINAIWQAPWACAQAFGSGSVVVPIELGKGQGRLIESVSRVPADPTFPYSIFHIPWIAYLSASLAAKVVPPAEILNERTPDGGLLMSATTDRLDPTNPEHLRRARILAEIMITQTGYQPGGTTRV
jgi:Immunity protein 52